MQDHWYERRAPRAASPGDARTALEVDHARVVHSSSVRRLAGKTQIHQGESDVPRTRLTHSMEVSQIALGIAQRLRSAHLANPKHHLDELLNDQAIWHVVGLCHDLGHPPLGHAGESALNACLPYEGNGQTLRILTRLESHTPGYGLNLTRRSLLGVLKYPKPYSEAAKAETPPPRRGISGAPLIGPEHKPPKCYHDEEEPIVAWLLSPSTIDESAVRGRMLKSFDCSLMDLSDEFAYSAADLDDAIAMGMMERGWIEEDICEDAWAGYLDHANRGSAKPIENRDDLYDRLLDGSASRRAVTGSIINYFLAGVRLVRDEEMADPLYRYQVELEAPQKRLMQLIKKSVFRRIIESTKVQQERVRTQRMIIEVFDAFSYQPMLYLPDRHRALWQAAENGDRVIADYIAGMTDRFLEKTHRTMMG